MDRQYALVVDAPRQKIEIEIENQGHPVQHLPPKKVTGHVEIFSYRFGKLGLIEPEVVDFHRRVTAGDEKARNLWNILEEKGDAKLLRNNSFLFERYAPAESLALVGLLETGSNYLSEGGFPLVFYDRKDSRSMSISLFGEERKKCQLEKYFVAGFTDSEVMILEGVDKKEIQDAVEEIYTLSGVEFSSAERRNLKVQFEMLKRYSPQMLPPYEVPLEVTRREYSDDEVKSKVEARRSEIEMCREMERSHRQGMSPEFIDQIIIGR